MPTWVLIAALASIVLTAVLTWVLYRINAPAMRRDQGGDGEGGHDGGGDGGGE